MVRVVEARNSSGENPIPGMSVGGQPLYSQVKGEIWVDGRRAAVISFKPHAEDGERVFAASYEQPEDEDLVEVIDQKLAQTGPIQIGRLPIAIDSAVILMGGLAIGDSHRQMFLASMDECYCFTTNGVFEVAELEPGESMNEAAARVRRTYPKVEELSREEMEALADQLFQSRIDLSTLTP